MIKFIEYKIDKIRLRNLFKFIISKHDYTNQLKMSIQF